MSQESVRGSQGVVHFAARTAQVRVPCPARAVHACLPCNQILHATPRLLFVLFTGVAPKP